MKFNTSLERLRTALGSGRASAAAYADRMTDPPGYDRGTAGSGVDRQNPAETDLHGSFRALADGLAELVLYIDAQQVCRAHNIAAERLLGLSPDRIDARPLRELAGDASYECIRSLIERALSGDEVFLRQVHRAADGTLLTFMARYLPHFAPDGSVLGFCAVLTPESESPAAAGGADAEADEAAQAAIGVQESGVEAEASSSEQALHREALRRITTALQADRFCLYQQAIVAAQATDARALSREILVRLRDEEQRLIHPGAFLGLAKEAGCMGELDRWVVDRLLRWFAAEASAGRTPAESFHVNLSTDSVRAGSFPVLLRQMLEAVQVPAGSFCFEIGEDDLGRHRLQVMACAQALRMLGCRVALDRFKGASGSFSTMLDLPIDFVKIDGSIVAGALTDAQARTKLKIILKLAQSKGIRTIAEQVETVDMVQFLRRIGVDCLQGYAVAMPEPLAP